ncbi:uncharacterized protein LOC111009816 [Momordica charantia]|uniref:Uncharacterized protein LOC111009816 n=1 Tax=Momordica charantia TaxID=3673 RepID=A0A6J1CA76_MOMCH|nr:uncharacterized protein LOC111009816 [Momordica charantia]
MEIMEVEDDDLLFAELTRRISLLIMDDDEELPIVHTNLTRTANRVRLGQSPLMADYENGFARESKGIGVFIPARSPQPRRKQRHTGGFRTKSENKRATNSQPSSTHYFKPKKG